MTARRPRLWPFRRTRRSDHVATGPASSNGAAPEDRPLVLVDGRMARRRKTGIATYIHELQHVMENRPASRISRAWAFGVGTE